MRIAKPVNTTLAGGCGTVIFVLVLFFCIGCEPQERSFPSAAGAEPGILCAYAPSKIHITGLTEMSGSTSGDQSATLKVCVNIIDSFDCRIKTPGIFRFELYEYRPRSANPRGTRIQVFPDLDLTEAVANNRYWRDFLRSYQFDMDVDLTPTEPQNFIIEATFVTPAGMRLGDIFKLKYP